MTTAIENNLIKQISRLPRTVVRARINPDNGLGSVSIYETVRNGLHIESIWVGREASADSLRAYLARRQQEVTA